MRADSDTASRILSTCRPSLAVEEAQRIACHVADARLGCCLLQRGRLSLTHRDRLLRQDMLSLADGGQRALLQHVVRRGYHDGIHLAVLE